MPSSIVYEPVNDSSINIIARLIHWSTGWH